jgi:omega-6 fatty acid desaturase (delta-12 desaturase)
MNEAMLFQKYKSSYIAASFDFATYSIFMTGTIYSVWYFKESYLSFATVPLLGLMLVKTFIIFHDCGHGSYTPSKTINKTLELVLSVSVFTDSNWSKKHALHHRTSGLLHGEGDFNEVIFTTVNDLKSYPPFLFFLFKVFNHPVMLFTAAPFLYFFIYQRFGLCAYNVFSTAMHNAALLLFIQQLRFYGIFWHYAAAIQLMAMFAFFFFFNQHTFNPSYVVTEKWNMRRSALEGSSHILVPAPLSYFTCGIEFHHVHHANSKIPGYHTRQFHEEGRFKAHTMSLAQCLKNVWLISYDEQKGRYVTMEEIEATPS